MEVSERIKPIPVYADKEDGTIKHGRVMLKFNIADINRMKMNGRFFLPESLIKQGGHCLEFAEVIAVNEEETQVKVGDILAVSYQLIMVDIGNKSEDLHDNDWIEADEFGNEYACPYILRGEKFPKVFGIIRGKKVEPISGTVFCEPPEVEPPKSKIIILDAKPPNTQHKGFKCKVISVSPEDSKRMKIKNGDYVWCMKNSDIPITLKEKSYIRVPADRIIAVEKK